MKLTELTGFVMELLLIRHFNDYVKRYKYTKMLPF